MSTIQVRLANLSDRTSLAGLFHALWPDGPMEEHAHELEAILSEKPSGTLPLVVFVAETSGQSLLGFIEVGLRSHADHCDPALPVGYVEGWYVVEGQRQGCVEMASDTQIGNELSLRVHESLGFRVVERAILFHKSLR
jgi:aminoglycoside 6'-N-acetyltransferase I